MIKYFGVVEHPRTFIAGGVFLPYLNVNIPSWKDIDVFVLGGEAGAAEYLPLLSGCKKQENSEYMSKKYSHIHQVYESADKRVQIICTHHNTREEVIRGFDYVHCCVSYDFKNMFISKQTYTSIMNKTLIRNNNNVPEQYRTKKFLDRGFTIDPNEAVEFLKNESNPF